MRTRGCLPLFLLLFLFSCKKESTDIGLDLIGDESLANAINVEYRNLSFRTVADDTFIVNSLSSSLLGIINDPVFGESKASLVIQPQLTETGINLNGNTIDSTQLNLVFDLYQTVDEGTRITNYELNYGDVESELVFDIYKLGEDLSDDVYFSNYTPSLGPKIGEYSGKFNLDSVKREVDGEVVTLSPRMTVKLDNTFGQEILDYDETTLSSNDNFIEIMKGLVLIPRSIVSGDGAIVAVEAINTRSSLDLFYSDSLQLAIPLGVSSKRVNFFETTHTPVIEEQKMGGVGHFDITYVQSLGGTKVRIEAPQLDSIIELDEGIVINEAKLEVSIDTSLDFNGNFEQAPRLWLLTPDTSNLNQSMTSFLDFNDVRFSESYYDAGSNSYTFYFNRYLQQLKQTYRSTGRNEFNWFYLSVPNDYPITPHRVIVDSDTMSGSVKLSVKYTKLN